MELTNDPAKDSDDELLNLLWEGNADTSQSSEEDFDTFAYSRLCSTPIKESTSPRGKEFLEFCNYFNDPSRPSSSAYQDDIAGSVCPPSRFHHKTNDSYHLDGSNDSWPQVLFPRYCALSKFYQDSKPDESPENMNYQGAIGRAASLQEELLSHCFPSPPTRDVPMHAESALAKHSTTGTTCYNPPYIPRGLNWAAKIFTPMDAAPLDLTKQNFHSFGDEGTSNFPDMSHRPPSFRYNLAFTESSDSEEELEGPKHFRYKKPSKPKFEAPTAEPDSFAEIEEFAYDPLPNIKFSFSPKAQLFEILYNYHTDTTRPPSSKILPMIIHNYENPAPTTSSTKTPEHRPPVPTTASTVTPEHPHSVLSTVSTVTPGHPHPDLSTLSIVTTTRRLPPHLDVTHIQMLENLRQLRHLNLLKWWAVHSLVYEKPKLLVDCEPSASESTGGLGTLIKKRMGRPSLVKCQFCLKNGEMPIVYESHALKDAQGNITCPILQNHQCENCSSTGIAAHTKKHCPLTTGSNEQSYNGPIYRRLANGSISSNFNHK